MNAPFLRLAFVLRVIITILLVGCGEDKSPGPITKESDHFVVISQGNAIMGEVDEILAKAESLFTGISSFLGNSPDKPIRILLEGDFQSQGPYFDYRGIHLYRYSSQEGGYLSLLAHEMVHAFGESYYIANETWNWKNYGFYDEALAEYVAQEVEPEKQGFPFYGFPEDIVAGQLLITGNEIPFDVLRNRHHELNLPCNLQTYTQRASWMRHMDELLGRSLVLDITRGDSEPTDEHVESLIGMSLPALDSLWAVWLLNRYHSIPSADTQAEAFRQRTSWYDPCKEGIDY